MTIARFLDLLCSHPPTHRVVVDGYEQGGDLSPECVLVKGISLDTGTGSWQGKHRVPRDGSRTDPDAVQTVEALVFRCASW